MPSKRHTKKDKRTGRKQKNTTSKKKSLVGERKSLDEALGEKLTPEFIENLVETPNELHSIQIEYCADNNFVVNTSTLFETPRDFLGFAPEKTNLEFKNMDEFTIPDDLQVGKQLEIIMYASEEGHLMYGTRIQENNKIPRGNKKSYHKENCAPDKLPVIYSVPKITTPDIEASRAEISSVTDKQSGEEVPVNNISQGVLTYNERTTPDDLTEQGYINMDYLQEGDLEDVTDIAQSSVTEPTDVSKELKETIKEEETKEEETKVEFIAIIAALRAELEDAKVRNPYIADTIHKLKSDIIKSWNTGFIKDTIIKTIGEENNTNLQNIFENVLCRLYPLTFGKYEAPLREGFLGYGTGGYDAKHSHTVDAIEGINYYLGTLINDKLHRDIETKVINDVSTFINDFKKKDGFNYIEGCHTSELVKGKCPVDTLKCKNADENTKEATTIIADFENIGARLNTNDYNEKESFSKEFVQIDGKLRALIHHINNEGLTTNLAKIKTNISSKKATDDIQPIFIKQNIELLKKFIENYVSEKSKTQGGKKTRKNRRRTKQRKTKKQI